MRKKRVAINGMGRIGRLCFRALLGREDIEVIAVNDREPIDIVAYLIRHSTEHGALDYMWNVEAINGALVLNGNRIPAFGEENATNLPWKDLGVDLVLECTGVYSSRVKAQAHIDAGARRVLVSAAAGNDVPTVIYGINEGTIDDNDLIVSGASCSAVGLAPLVKALNEIAPIEHGISTTIHALTPTQMVLDNPQRNGNLRRSRTAFANIVPTTASAAKSVELVLPELKGKLSGSAIRVPVAKGSYITFVAIVKTPDITAEKLNCEMKKRATGLFGYAEEELVSGDIAGTSHESIFDPFQTKVQKLSDGNYLVETGTWFDNETSYTSHFINLAAIM